MKKIDEISRFSKKELRLTKESMGWQLCQSPVSTVDRSGRTPTIMCLG